jgi:hypothetical protein
VNGDTPSLLADDTYVQHIVTAAVAAASGNGSTGAAETVLVRKEIRLRVGREHLSEKLYCKVGLVTIFTYFKKEKSSSLLI